MENASTNPLLAKIKLPGRTFQLPSRGVLYHNGEVAGSEGEIHVHPMSALAEISLKNPDLLFNGKALNQVFKECIPEIKNPTQLYGRDIDAIMYYLRLVTYGPEFEIRVKHDCEESKQRQENGEFLTDKEGNLVYKEHSYIVNIEELVQKIRFLDPTVAEADFQCTLPNGQVVKVHPVKFDHMIKLFQMNTGKKEFTSDDIKKNVVFNLVNLIESVDDITDKKLIEEWVSSITTPYQNRITDAIEKTNEWGPDQTVTLTCKDCRKEMPVDLPLNPISFFTE
ncbi:hypothetical protein [Acinetobacter sp.]|uniref:T4 family baseplate hub assembly chaperone n=1 Tax=Acinetobacter sp. TaxID=472 RepID=UPI0038906615